MTAPDGDAQVAVGQRRGAVLVGDDLALLGDLDGALERPVGLGKDGVGRRSPAPAHRAAPAVEEAQAHAVLGGDVAQGPHRLVDLPP